MHSNTLWQERALTRAEWPQPDGNGSVRLERVEARAGDATTRRVFRGWLHNTGDTTEVVTLDISLPAPFLPSAAVLMSRLFTVAPGERLRVELGSTVGSEPSAETVRDATTLRIG